MISYAYSSLKDSITVPIERLTAKSVASHKLKFSNVADDLLILRNTEVKNYGIRLESLNPKLIVRVTKLGKYCKESSNTYFDASSLDSQSKNGDFGNVVSSKDNDNILILVKLDKQLFKYSLKFGISS